MSVTASPPRFTNVAQLQEYLGDIPLNRIRQDKVPATEADLIFINEVTKPLCELVFGVLVEKPMGSPESILAAELIGLLTVYNLSVGRIGHVMAPDSMIRFAPDVVRQPDVAFIKWERYPGGKAPITPIYIIASRILPWKFLAPATPVKRWFANVRSILKPVWNKSG